MGGRFNNPFVREQEDPGNTPESRTSSPFPGVISDGKTTAASSPKRRIVDPDSDSARSTRSRRRAVQKRVVSVPIIDVEGSRLKGEGAPPSDSWAWRKYGQKPIKGSPYPRGYYRCSSSKGCPARKQVERSRSDPTMLMVTYACEHNHPWPIPRNSINTQNTSSTSTTPPTPKFQPDESSGLSNPSQPIEPEEKFAALTTDDSLMADDFGWLSDSPSKEAVLHSPVFTASNDSDDMAAAMVFPMGEEDESLFADLGELPESSVVFGRGLYEQRHRLQGEEIRRCGVRAATWCGSTG